VIPCATAQTRGPVGVLVVLQLLVSLPLAWLLNLYVDEVYSLHTAAQGPLGALAGGIHFERQAPLYFGLLSLWQMIDASVFFARLLSILCISASLVVLAQVARRLFPGVHPAWFVAPFALHPAAIWASVEIRVYALAMLLAALLLWSGLAAFFGPERRRGAVSAFVATAVVSLYTFYYLGFLLVGLGAALLASGRRQELGRYAAALAAVGLLCAPIGLWVSAQAGVGGEPGRLSAAGALRFWGTILADQAVPGHRLTAALGSRSARWVARGLLLALGAAVLVRWRLVSRLRESSLQIPWIALAVAAALFAAVGWLVGRGLVEPERYWTYLALPATLAVVGLVAAAGSERLLAATVVLLAAANAAELIVDYRPLAKPSDARHVAALLMREERPGEPILVFPNEWALPLRYEYHGVNPIVPVPREVSLERYDLAAIRIHSAEELETMMAALPKDEGTLWLVKDDEVYQGREHLDRYVASHFAVEASWPFYRKLVVQRLHRR